MSQCPACNAEIVTYEPRLKRFHDGARGEHSGTAVCPLKVVLLPVHREGQGAPAAPRRQEEGTTRFSLGEKGRPSRLRCLAVARRAFNRSWMVDTTAAVNVFLSPRDILMPPVLYLPRLSRLLLTRDRVVLSVRWLASANVSPRDSTRSGAGISFLSMNV